MVYNSDEDVQQETSQDQRSFRKHILRYLLSEELGTDTENESTTKHTNEERLRPYDSEKKSKTGQDQRS